MSLSVNEKETDFVFYMHTFERFDSARNFLLLAWHGQSADTHFAEVAAADLVSNAHARGRVDQAGSDLGLRLRQFRT